MASGFGYPNWLGGSFSKNNSFRVFLARYYTRVVGKEECSLCLPILASRACRKGKGITEWPRLSLQTDRIIPRDRLSVAERENSGGGGGARGAWPPKHVITIYGACALMMRRSLKDKTGQQR